MISFLQPPFRGQSFLILASLGFIQCSQGTEVRKAGPSVAGGSNAAGTANTAGAANIAGGPTGSGGAGTAGAESTGGSSAGGNTASGGATSPADWLFYEDFEGHSAGEPPAAPWTVTGYGSKIVATTSDKAFSGTQSAHFHVDQPARSFITTMQPFPIAGNAFYGRMMIWFDQLPTSTQGVHWDMISASGGGEEKYLWGGQYDHILGNYFPGDCYEHENALKPQTGKWHCVEWQFDGPNNSLYIWLDGAEGSVIGRGEGCVDGENVWTAPARFSEISFGWSHYQADIQANDVWIDDIAIDDQRIGCPAP